MTGKIIKGIAGFYYVLPDQGTHSPSHQYHAENESTTLGIYECKAKGIFRNKKMKPMVGDNVTIEIIDEENYIGNIIDILPRSSQLIRPAVANVDQVMIIFAVAEPTPNFNLLDRFLVSMILQDMKAIICFNKTDIISEEELEKIVQIYENTGYTVLVNNIEDNVGIQELKKHLLCKTTAFAGPSGVGKSSILNLLSKDVKMETGTISEKIKRGKHTTRHSELICIGSDTYIMDTPGFSSLFVDTIERPQLKDYYIEFLKYEDKCRFQGCVHINEPDCAVKEAVNKGEISNNRYKTYMEIYEDLPERKQY